MVASLPEVWTHVAPWVIPEPPIRLLGRIAAFHLGLRPYECSIGDVRYSNWKVQASAVIEGYWEPIDVIDCYRRLAESPNQT